VKRKRDLIVTNLLALAVLAAVLLLGWWDAALLGLVVLALMNLLALVRELGARATSWPEEADEQCGEAVVEPPATAQDTRLPESVGHPPAQNQAKR
jgi:hypothetical protein